MITVLSPAKSLDFESPVSIKKHTMPDFIDKSEQIIRRLRDYDPEQLSELMHISSKLGELNYERNANWQQPFDSDNARQAIFAFTGDVYVGFNAAELKSADLDFAQKHLRILSGLYGLLRPLDLIQPYRLEMGTTLAIGGHNNLYQFWGDQLTEALNQLLDGSRSPLLVNLASNEYFKAVNRKRLQGDIVSPAFKDYKNGEYKMISFYAKKARGMMASWIVRNRIDSADALLDFDMAGYRYSAEASGKNKPVFLRREAA